MESGSGMFPEGGALELGYRAGLWIELFPQNSDGEVLTSHMAESYFIWK